MELKTKYSLRDIVWVVLQNEVRRCSVEHISIEINSLMMRKTIYKVRPRTGGSGEIEFTEHELFSTKEELLNSL